MIVHILTRLSPLQKELVWRKYFDEPYHIKKASMIVIEGGERLFCKNHCSVCDEICARRLEDSQSCHRANFHLIEPILREIPQYLRFNIEKYSPEARREIKDYLLKTFQKENFIGNEWIEQGKMITISKCGSTFATCDDICHEGCNSCFANVKETIDKYAYLFSHIVKKSPVPDSLVKRNMELQKKVNNLEKENKRLKGILDSIIHNVSSYREVDDAEYNIIEKLKGVL